jgi:hypothetical protein
VRTFLIVLSLWLGLAAGVYAAETWTLTDGTSVSGDIIKFDDNGAMIRTTGDAYNTVPWAQFSQDSLKHLAETPKLRLLVEPFIEPTAPEHKAKAAIQAPTVTRVVESPDQLHPSIFGGLAHSSLGLFILLVLYVTNLYAAFEVAVVRGRAIGLVMGISAVLPVAGPILFLAQPVRLVSQQEAVEGAEPQAPAGATGTLALPGQENVEVVTPEEEAEKKNQPQVFTRGKFTFNRRFIETKFAGYLGEPKGDAKLFAMELKTQKGALAVQSIKQVGMAEAIFVTGKGTVTVPFADIQEIKLTPKPA